MAWSQLPAELWSTIFSDTNYAHGAALSNIQSCAEAEGTEHAELYTLRTVCKRFNTVLLQHPALQKTLMVTQFPISIDNLAHLVKWIRRLHAVENLILSTSDVCAKAVLTAFTQHPSAVHRANVNIAHTDTAQLLPPALPLIDTLVLSAAFTTDGHLSLCPLSGLQRLTCLVLQHGRYTDLDAAVHLQSLSLAFCIASSSQNCSLVSSLLKLDLCHADLYNLHQNGLSAWVKLQELRCVDAQLFFSSAAANLVLIDCQPVEGLANLTGLTALTQLYLTINSRSPPQPRLDCLCSLTNLEDLSLAVWGQHVELPQGMQSLKKLKKLQVQFWEAS